MEILFLVVLIFVIYLIYIASLPRTPVAPATPPAPLPPQVTCPRCGAQNYRFCPNCGKVIPSGTLLCPSCHIAATSLPCRVCRTDLRNIP